MGRIRTIKPEFYRHEELYLLEKETGLPMRVAFSGLWTVADREGRFKWKPKQIKMDVLPYDDVDMELVLSLLWENGFIRKYVIDAIEYAWIPSFSDHQVINNREAKSKIPPEPSPNPFRKDASFTRHGNYQGEGKGRKGKEGNTQMACVALAEIFGRKWETDPDNVMPDLFTWYREVENQAEILLRNFATPEALVKQVKAYKKHCDESGRKMISHAYKLSETILQCDWVGLTAPEPVARAEPYKDAAKNKANWTDEAWRQAYKRQIETDPEFRKHFQITQTALK